MEKILNYIPLQIYEFKPFFYSFILMRNEFVDDKEVGFWV